MAKGRKLRVTLAELPSGPTGKRWEITLSSGDGVIVASGALGRLTAIGRLDVLKDVLTRFILWGQMPDAERRKKIVEAADLDIEVMPYPEAAP